MRKYGRVARGAFTNAAMSGAPQKSASASAAPSTTCMRTPARCTASARASSSAVNFETAWIVACTTVLLTIEMTLLTTAKAPKSARPEEAGEQHLLHEAAQHEVDLGDADEDGPLGRPSAPSEAAGAGRSRSRLDPRDDAVDAAQIAARPHVGEAGRRAGARPSPRACPAPISSDQRAAGREQRRRRGHQPPHQRQPVGAAVERQRRLALHLGGQRRQLARRECTAGWRRSARTARAAASGASRSPSTNVTARPSRSALRARHLQRRRARHRLATTAAAGKQLGQRQRDARPSRCRRRRCAGRRRDAGARLAPFVARLLDQRLGVGARHQHARVDGEARSPRTPSCRPGRRPTRPPGAA